MKKLRMIVTSVVVLAIVGSAFAFNAKKIGKFCVSANSTSTDCSEVISGSKRTTTGTVNRKYYCGWDQASTTSCTDLTTECDTQARFVAE